MIASRRRPVFRRFAFPVIVRLRFLRALVARHEDSLLRQSIWTTYRHGKEGNLPFNCHPPEINQTMVNDYGPNVRGIPVFQMVVCTKWFVGILEECEATSGERAEKQKKVETHNMRMTKSTHCEL